MRQMTVHISDCHQNVQTWVQFRLNPWQPYGVQIGIRNMFFSKQSALHCQQFDTNTQHPHWS